MFFRFACAFTLFFSVSTFSQLWEKGERIADGGRDNPYELSFAEFEVARKHGLTHSLYYPVTATGILLPYGSINRVLEGSFSNPLKSLISGIVGAVSPFRSFDELQSWLGLQTFPSTLKESWPLDFPQKNNQLPDHRMGMTFMPSSGGMGFTLSCAQCHSDTVFGRRIIGMSNRFPRANDFFQKGLQVTPRVSAPLFQWASSSSDEETALFKSLKEVTPYIGAKKPVQLGLDTSLAQVALSLAKRSQDEYSSKTPTRRRRDLLDNFVADSKPAVWWGLKYKNRWLSDGSVVSGNPIFTNIIWNELGRGADLRKIEDWLSQNSEVIKELTTAVFSSTPPPITEFFPAEKINLDDAMAGEKHFNQQCAKCHGVYFKNWSLPDSHNFSLKDKLKTYFVRYPEETFVVDVGTDPGRYQGMVSLTPLNKLAISKTNNILIEPQQGYVPPPLDGIWLRWPYFHNNSAPSLCAVLTKGRNRPLKYWARRPDNKEKDFDFECNGYPKGRPGFGTPSEFLYDSQRKGLSRFGHDEGIFLTQGQEIFTPKEKQQLIQFLQTL